MGKPILVTGGNCTETTRVWRMLATSTQPGSIKEAFGTKVGLLKETDTLKFEFQYIPPENVNEKHIADVKRLHNFQYTAKHVLGGLGDLFLTFHAQDKAKMHALSINETIQNRGSASITQRSNRFIIC